MINGEDEALFGESVCLNHEHPTIDGGLRCFLVVGTKRRVDGERDPSPSAQETPVVRVQPDRRMKTKEPGFRYTA